MRDYYGEYSNLQKAMNDEALVLYKMLAKKLGSEELYMGDDPITKRPRILPNREVVRVNCNIRIEGYYTKINHIGLEQNNGCGERVFIKGWMVNRARYRLKTFSDLDIHEKIDVLQYMNNLAK